MRSELSRLRASLASAESRLALATEALEKIAEAYHADRSCSLEAQGYDKHECEVIVEKDSLASVARAAIEKVRSKP